MDIRNAIKVLFGGLKQRQTAGWREVGRYNSIFSPYNTDIYANDICRAAIRTLAENTSKANPRCKDDPRLERLLQYRPNMYMNGKDFLYKCRTRLELDNTLFIYLNRDDRGRVISLYPMPPCQAEPVEADGRLFIKFSLNDGTWMTAAWDDLGVLHKDYNTSDVFGDSNSAISTSLELLDTTNKGMANAIKSTANLRGILKFTKGQIKQDDIKAAKSQFVSDYLAMENSSGIAATDASMDFVPITLQPALANYKSVEELRNNIYRYFGVNEDAVTSRLVGDAWDAFYSAQIEPFLVALGLELTYKVYTDRERGFGNEIAFESNRLRYMSMNNKLQLVQLIDRKTLLPNEMRQIMNLPPVPWGDEPLFWQNPKENENKDKNEEPEKEGIKDEP